MSDSVDRARLEVQDTQIIKDQTAIKVPYLSASAFKPLNLDFFYISTCIHVIDPLSALLINACSNPHFVLQNARSQSNERKHQQRNERCYGCHDGWRRSYGPRGRHRRQVPIHLRVRRRGSPR